jgi:hypothetical protein
VDPALSAAIRQLLGKLHVREMTVSSMQTMIGQVRHSGEMAKMPDAIWDAFSSKLDSLGGLLLENTIPVYAKYYTLAEIQHLSTLYDDPVLQKSLQITPQVMAETMQMGSNIGRETMTNIVQAYLVEHPDFLAGAGGDTTPPETGKKKKKK